MAASRIPELSQDATYSAMQLSQDDVDAIGARCQMLYCRQLDFLPFKCESCKGKYCLDHRSETAHECKNAGAWARRRAQAQQTDITRAYTPSPKPTLLNHEQQCADPSCKTLINTPLVLGIQCDKCNRSYCLKHRFTNQHNCEKLTPLGARPAGQTQREKGLAAFEKLKIWGATKRAALPKAPVSSSKQAAAARVQEMANLKKTAKGDAKIPMEKRVYLYVEASSDTVASKQPKGTFFYNTDFNVGKTLDLAAKSLQVSNINNRSDSEEDKLRVFHVEGGKLLGFSEKLAACVQTGNTIVLLRGIGPGEMAVPPSKT
ncbi:hypothetical protein LTR62_008889 [Meristemomyces frigidus]|uniref:AN1-type domain-containing protein n=1 Tax=Meristemomyces frigidus TaxID=1508187 RepID=A0AAN7YMY5_9PEZI|nr:hypothetical protein LTR62_008889 [Meristemomyces frigidus]